ncbi:hypothetical protein OAO01_08900 [Oligoflexia bacterium]|nr:hypothetical protein [Oligoflexia bacterium]
MNTLLRLILVFVFSCVCCSATYAQECTETDKDALDTCVDTCKTTCLAQYPQCEQQPVDLAELDAAVDEKCGACAEDSESFPKNYGKYRSCVMSVLNVLKKFALIDNKTKQAMLAKSKACKALIKANKKKQKENKKPKENNGKKPE